MKLFRKNLLVHLMMVSSVVSFLSSCSQPSQPLDKGTGVQAYNRFWSSAGGVTGETDIQYCDSSSESSPESSSDNSTKQGWTPSDKAKAASVACTKLCAGFADEGKAPGANPRDWCYGACMLVNQEPSKRCACQGLEKMCYRLLGTGQKKMGEACLLYHPLICAGM